jgi:thioredoxin-like negative regulator of GroEL
MKGNSEPINNEIRTVIADFHALWSGTRKALTQAPGELAAQSGARVRVINIEVDQNNSSGSLSQIQRF